MKKACAVLSYRQTLLISFTSAVESREVERHFFTHFTERGVPVSLKEY
jgi:hypothetical protein